MTKNERFEQVTAWFLENMPVAETELVYDTPYELIVAVILSAQCTDKRVNIITPALFLRFPTPQALADADITEIYEYIKSCSYPNNKAKHLSGMAKMLVDEYGGQLPTQTNDLQKLPGVGRKTANVVASVLFDMPVMPVDTHVHRVAARLGLTDNAKTPLQTENQLVSFFPTELIAKAHHWLILHGRYVCIARKPKCSECGLSFACRYFSEQH